MSLCVLLDNSDTCAVFCFECFLVFLFDQAAFRWRSHILKEAVQAEGTFLCSKKYYFHCDPWMLHFVMQDTLSPCFVVVLPLFWLGLPCLPSWKLLPVVSGWSCVILPCSPNVLLFFLCSLIFSVPFFQLSAPTILQATLLSYFSSFMKSRQLKQNIESLSTEYSSQGLSWYHSLWNEHSSFFGKPSTGWQGPMEQQNLTNLSEWSMLCFWTCAGSVGYFNEDRRE